MGKLKLLSCAAGLVFGLMAQAHAGPIVTDWTGSVTSVWTGATFSAADGTTSTSATTLNWGDANVVNRSSLVITNVAASPLKTIIGNAPPVAANIGLGSTVTHNNNPIGGASLTGATLQTTLTLATVAPVASALPGALAPLNVSIDFTETTNGGVCASATNGTPCDDIFVLTGGLLNQTFTYDAVQYFINVFPLAGGGSFSQLLPAVCSAAGVANGCIGFVTEESHSTAVKFGFTISTEALVIDVPEPDILALVGLALGACALARRRRH